VENEKKALFDKKEKQTLST